MYNNGNDRTNGADEIMRRLMDITGRGITDDAYDYDGNNGFRSIHGVPEGSGQGDEWSVPTLSPQRPSMQESRPPQRPQRPSMPENRPPQRPERPPMSENRPPQRPERPPMPENRPPQRPERPPIPENRPPQRPERPEPPKPQKPMQPCGCMRPGYAYVKPQKFEDINEPDRALKRGTLFRILDLPKNVYEMKEED